MTVQKFQNVTATSPATQLGNIPLPNYQTAVAHPELANVSDAQRAEGTTTSLSSIFEIGAGKMALAGISANQTPRGLNTYLLNSDELEKPKAGEVHKMGDVVNPFDHSPSDGIGVMAQDSSLTFDLTLPKRLSKAKRDIIVNVAREMSAIAGRTAKGTSGNNDIQMIKIGGLDPRGEHGAGFGAMQIVPPSPNKSAPAHYALSAGGGASKVTDTEFQALMRHEFMHMLGMGVPGDFRWDKLVDVGGNGDVDYRGSAGCKAFARLHGLTDVPAKFALDTKSGGGHHLPRASFDTLSGGGFGDIGNGGRISGLAVSIMKDLGYNTVPAKFDRLINLPNQDAVWAKGKNLSSSNGKFTAGVSDTGKLIIKDNTTQSNHAPFEVQGSDDKAVVKLTKSGVLQATTHDGKALWSTPKPSNVPQTGNPFSLTLTNDGALEIQEVKLNGNPNYSTLGDINWSSEEQHSAKKDEL